MKWKGKIGDFPFPFHSNQVKQDLSVKEHNFLPTRSPNQPKNAPPTGRAANPAKFVVNAAMVPAKGSSVGKKSFEKTVAEKNVYKKKSYHSIAVPNVLALITGNILCNVVISFAAPFLLVSSSSLARRYTCKNDNYYLSL